jgi:hypothetical protein
MRKIKIINSSKRQSIVTASNSAMPRGFIFHVLFFGYDIKTKLLQLIEFMAKYLCCFFINFVPKSLRILSDKLLWQEKKID